MRKASWGQRRRERKISRAGHAILICYLAALLAGLVITFSTVGAGEAKIYQSRSQQDPRLQDGVSFWTEDDPTATLGYVEHCQFRLGNLPPGVNNLGFYVSQSYIEVKLGGTEVYSLEAPSEEAGKSGEGHYSPGNVYVSIAIDGDDSGKLVDVVLEPTIDGAQGRAPQFYVGSLYKTYQHRLLADLPQLILCVVAMIVGAVYLGVGVWNVARGQRRIDMLLLGLFALLLGLWKLLDTRFIALVAAQTPHLVSNISIACLSLLPPLALGYFGYRLKSASHRVLSAVGAFSVLCVLAVELLFALDIADLRATLIITHVSIVATAVVLTICLIRELRHVEMSAPMRAVTIAGLLVALGSAVDFISFYTDESHGTGSMAELLVVLAFVVVDGIVTGSDLSRRASLDAQTGISNRSACFELLDDPEPLDAGVGFAMFDLNGLKEANDNLGHEAGDRLIVRLAHALFKVSPRGAFVGRSGGDEFICVIEDTSADRLQILIAAVHSAADADIEEGELPLSFSAGYAISYKGETMHELYRRADEAMYRQKEAFYQGVHERRRTEEQVAADDAAAAADEAAGGAAAGGMPQD